MATSQNPSAHEDFSREETAKAGSERSFGFVFAGFCAIVAAIQLWVGNLAFWGWVIAAVAFTVAAIAAPRVLRPLNIVWFKFGMLLHHIVSPVVLGLMFYAVFTPIGLWMRLIGKRPLSLRFQRDAQSYWVLRKPPGPPPASFNNQF
jgi:hypothetical protein